MTQELHVFSNDVIDWVIAHNADDATEVVAEHRGERIDDVGPYAWQCHAPTDLIAVREDDGVVEMTAAEWVAFSGRGFLCSTEY